MMPLPPLSTLNGTGTRLLGLRPQADGSFFATAWDVRAYLPIRPLSRHRLRLEGVETRMSSLGASLLVTATSSLVVLEETPLEVGEVWRTRLLGWVAAPLLVFGPALIVSGAWQWLSEFSVAQGLRDTQLPAASLLGAGLWASVCGMILADRQRKALERLDRARQSQE